MEAAAKLAADVELKRQDIAKGTLSDLLQYGGLVPKDPKTGKLNPEYIALREKVTPGIGEELEQGQAKLFNQQVQEGLATYQGRTKRLGSNWLPIRRHWGHRTLLRRFSSRLMRKSRSRVRHQWRRGVFR